jgi:SAM-dependent methyltransferase
MIIHRLIRHHLRHGPDAAFYALQAEDAIAWLTRQGVRIGPPTRVLDLGCGSGVFGLALQQAGCEVRFADAENWLPKDTPGTDFVKIDIDTEDPGRLGRFDLVVCSNVLEHLRHPARLIASLGSLLRPGGRVYLSWTNWLSPWGGHDFSPFHYLGPRLGPKLFDRFVRRPRALKPYENLFPTHVGRTLRWIRAQPDLRLLRAAPRYYTELGFLMRLPVLREFLAWNCALLLERTSADTREMHHVPPRPRV